MGLAATEVGLQFDDGITPVAGQPLPGTGEEEGEALGEVCAPEELGWVAVFGFGPAGDDLEEVGGEFGLTVAARGHVRMGGCDLAPGFEAGRDAGFDDGVGLLGALPGFGLKTPVQHVLGQGLQLIPALTAHHFEQAGHGVQGPIGIFRAEGLLMGPAVAHLAQLADVAASHVAQLFVEDLAPIV